MCLIQESTQMIGALWLAGLEHNMKPWRCCTKQHKYKHTRPVCTTFIIRWLRHVVSRPWSVYIRYWSLIDIPFFGCMCAVIRWLPPLPLQKRNACRLLSESRLSGHFPLCGGSPLYNVLHPTLILIQYNERDMLFSLSLVLYHFLGLCRLRCLVLLWR